MSGWNRFSTKVTDMATAGVGDVTYRWDDAKVSINGDLVGVSRSTCLTLQRCRVCVGRGDWRGGKRGSFFIAYLF